MPSASSLTSIRDVLAALRGRRRLRVLGAEGGFLGLLLARAATDPEAKGPLVYVARDEASARAAAADAGFFLGLSARESAALDGPVVVVPENEASPYGDAATDPRVLAQRLGALYRLQAADAERPRLIVIGLRSLTRKVIPPATFARLCRRWRRGGEIELEEASAALVAAGYQRVDVVEDPGTFAVRGGVVDVYPAIGRFPVRIELFGDEIERLRLFDPDSQRSLREVEEVVIHPVREAIAPPLAQLRPAILALADHIEVPSSRTRQVLDNLEQGLDFFGEEALTPVFH
ncbi:MAG: transcription-repair coupling factor, partial [Myxococcales bacterium]|nr:transcription-repair coupling factor [Myxococcales bacterium]